MRAIGTDRNAVDSIDSPASSPATDCHRPPRSATPECAGAEPFRHGCAGAIHRWAAVAILLALPGCLPVALGAGAALGGGRPAASSGNAQMPGGQGIQHSRPADRSIGDALHLSEGEVTEGCRSLIPETDAPDPDRACQMRWVCLPNAPAPMRLRVCEARDVAPESVPAGAAPRIAAWPWGGDRP